jgi:hypothetical protein
VNGRTWRLVWGVALVAMVGCRARWDEFHAAVHTCNLADPAEACGTTADGKPMTCFAGSQLGGSDFCAPACDPSQATGGPGGFTCARAGVLLQSCTPMQPGSCPQGLSCLRTSLLTDSGVCVLATVCDDDADCSGVPGHPVCAGTVLDRIIPLDAALPFHTDSFQCLEDKCRTGCPTGESCLGEVYEIAPPLGDICVPNCRNGGGCPPNYSCTKSPVQDICVPGLPGTRCVDHRDCVVGFCMATGEEFSICSMPCSDDAFCAAFNSPRSDTFVCAFPPDLPPYCVTARPLKGLFCAGPDDCPAGQKCFNYSHDRPQGTCQVPCNEALECPARGGLPHTCVVQDDGNRCSPGDFGKPCHGLATAECILPLTCREVSAEAFGLERGPGRICSISCLTDADCDDEPATVLSAFCGVDHVCREASLGGDTCGTGAHCVSDRCHFGECAVDPIGP